MKSDSAAALVLVDPSQFPAQVEHDLLAALRRRQANHKFHYDSVKQAQKWLRVHEAFSPARRDDEGVRLYATAAAALAENWRVNAVQVVGLGCGGGRKDVALIWELARRGRSVGYVPLDVSLPLTLVAREAALEELPPERIQSVVCDVAVCGDLNGLLAPLRPAGAARCYTFFGMVPNFEPGACLPSLAGLLEASDRLLVSANLAPGDDYASGVARVLPQYDNAPTRDWLLTWLEDLGVDTQRDGVLRFLVEADPGGSPLRRIAAYFDFHKSQTLRVAGETFIFQPGESFRLFFSYRHTPELLRGQLAGVGLQVEASWLLPSGEEGVFLCRPVPTPRRPGP